MRDHPGLNFPLSEYERRLSEVRSRIVERQLDAVVIMDPENLLYLTGHQTTGYSYLQALIIPASGKPVSLTRHLEESNILARTWVEETRVFSDTEDEVHALWHVLVEFGLDEKRVGIERSSYFFPAYLLIHMSLALKSVDFVDCTGIVEQSRVTKSDKEIELMREAARAGLEGMKAGLDAIRPGITENDLAAVVHHAMYTAGGEYPSVAPYITSGPRTCIGHASWESRTLQAGDCVFLETAGCKKRYHAAMMRTAVIGEPSADMKQAEGIVLRALDAMLETARTGATVGEVDAAARAILDTYTGSGGNISRTGYGMGIAFPPSWDEGYIVSIKPGSPVVLRENMTFHFLPWMIGIDGTSVMGISETVRVTDAGAEPLVEFDRGVRIIDPSARDA